MPPKVSVKSLIEESLGGNFENVHKTISSKQIQLETVGAIKILVAICNACYQNLSTPENLNERHLIAASKCLLKFIQVPNDQNYESYAQSAFYIVKLLMEKKKFNCIVELEDLLLPEFMPLILTEKHNSIYQNISKSIYNVIVKIARGTEESDEDVALSLSYLLSRLYQKLDKVKLLETVHNSILGLVTLGVTSDKLLQFYQHVFVLIDRVEEPSLYPLLINNFSFLYTHLLKNEQFPLASACYKFTTNKLSQLFKTPDNYLLVAILEVVEWVTPGDENVFKHLPAQAHDKLKTYHARYQSTPDLQSICDFISSVAFTALQVYKKSNRWVAKMEAHLEFYAFLNDVSVIMSKTPYKCPCKGCPTRKNLNEALRTLNSVGGLGRLCITSDCEVSRTYKIEILRYLDKYIEYVAILKENNCAKWEKYWYDAGVHLYTIGAHLQQEKETEMFILYMQKFVQGVLQLEGFSSKVIGKNYLTSALNLIGDSFYESRDYEKCLLVTSLGIVSGECPKHEILRWMKAKAACRDSSIEENQDLQGLTLVSVFDKCGDELALYYPKGGFQLAPERKIELLLYELRQYNSKWKSKVPMSSAFRELSQIADSRETAEVFLEIWGDGEMLVHETLPLLLQDTVKRVEAEKLPNKELLLSHLYFLQHKYRVKDAIVKHCDEMERTMVVTKSGPESGDPNAECDLVSSYDCLKLSRYLKMVKELNKSLELVQEWMSRRELEESEEASRLYKLLAKIGHEYRLHGHIAKSLQAWELALKVATKEQSALYKVQASGFIIEMADVRRPLVATIVTEAEQCLFALKLNKNFEELIVYFLCKAEAFLYVEFNTAYKAFRQALNYHQEYRGSSILRARVHLVEHKFVTLPCRFPVDGHKEYSLVKIHQANNCANAYYNETTNVTSYDMRIFFDIYDSLAKMYHDLRLPREVRCYARDAVVIAQKMVLPMRTTPYLYYLALADIRSCRLDDCRVKIKDFSDILGLIRGNNPTNHLQARDKEKCTNVVDNLVDDFKEMMLDVPERARVTSSGSPSFANETFKSPSFLNHEDHCECFYCTCVEYQEFVLKKTYLNALLHQHDNNLSVAKSFFGGCVEIYQYLTSKQKIYSKKIAKRISAELVPVPLDRLVDTYCSVLLEYGNFTIRTGRLTDASSINKKTLDLLEPFSLQFVHLYNEVLAQKSNIVANMLFIEKPRLVNANQCEESEGAKTPHSKQSKVFLSPDCRPDSVELFKVIPKSLKFDLSDTEDEAEVKKTGPPKNLPPFLQVGKTPTPSASTMKVYRSANTGKVLVEIPAFKRPIEGSVGSSTPQTVKAGNENSLASRTKLLTERLRSSSRKGRNGADENSNKGGASGTRSSVRQNLQRQLDDAEEMERRGVVRRSTRNAK